MCKHPIIYLKPAFRAYLPTEIFDGCMFTDKHFLIDDATYTKIAYYGTTPELIEELEIFMDFPGSYSKFEMEPIFPYNIQPDVYTSLRKETYVYKQDIFLYFPQLLPIGPFGEEENRFISSIVSFFLRTKEDQYQNLLKLVKFGKEEKKKLEVLQENIEMKLQEASTKRPNTLSKPTLEDVFQKFKEMLPVNKMDPEYKSVLKELETPHDKKPVKTNAKRYEAIISWIGIIFEEFTTFLDKNPKWFSPKSEDAQNQKSEDQEGPVIVRLFEHKSQKFVMEYELLNIADDLDVDEMNELFEEKGVIRTIGFKELSGRLGTKMHNIEFVETPIHRAKHGAIYIPSFNGKHCILAGDFLVDMLREMISVKSIFQKINQSNWKYIQAICHMLPNLFNSSMQSTCFIDTEKAVEAKMTTFRLLKNYMGDSMNGTKDVRKVGADGFTPRDLKKEIQYLGLTEAFPQILNYAQMVYDILENSKENDVLRTCDMYEMLEHCQMICLLSRNATLFKFIHEQDQCGRFAMECPFCSGDEEAEKLANRKDGSDDASEESEDSDEKLTNSQPKTPESAPLDATNGDVTEVNEIAETEKMNKKKEKRRRAAEKKKMAREQPKAPKNEESNVCQKCFRNSQICNAANEALRLEQVKTKALSKELAEVTKKQLEKDEENQKLREKLAALQETVLQMQTQVSQESRQSDEKIP